LIENFAENRARAGQFITGILKVSLIASLFKSSRQTFAPWFASCTAMALPMPLPAPVTTATFPVRSKGMIYLDGKQHKTVPEEKLVDELFNEIEKSKKTKENCKEHNPKYYWKIIITRFC